MGLGWTHALQHNRYLLLIAYSVTSSAKKIIYFFQFFFFVAVVDTINTRFLDDFLRSIGKWSKLMTNTNWLRGTDKKVARANRNEKFENEKEEEEAAEEEEYNEMTNGFTNECA